MTRDHYATCVDYGRRDGAMCRGCAPRTAHDGSLLCGRCFAGLVRGLEDVGEVLREIHARGLPGQAKSLRLDWSTTRGDGSAVAPVHADRLDAIRDILDGLGVWAEHVSGKPVDKLPPHPSTGQVKQEADWRAAPILQRLGELANDAANIVPLCEFVLDEYLGDVDLEEASRGWTIQRAMMRWPAHERPKRSYTPCPDCDYRTITIRKPRTAYSVTTYRCSRDECDFARDDTDTDEPWTLIFEGFTEEMNA